MPKAAFPFGVKMQDGEDQEAEQGPEAHEWPPQDQQDPG
jgi:hypothetical protein